jgi:hypothetical protein
MSLAAGDGAMEQLVELLIQQIEKSHEESRQQVFTEEEHLRHAYEALAEAIMRTTIFLGKLEPGSTTDLQATEALACSWSEASTKFFGLNDTLTSICSDFADSWAVRRSISTEDIVSLKTDLAKIRKRVLDMVRPKKKAGYLARIRYSLNTRVYRLIFATFLLILASVSFYIRSYAGNLFTPSFLTQYMLERAYSHVLVSNHTPDGQISWHYTFGPGFGLARDCPQLTLFNAFGPDTGYTTARLWADACKSNCYIHTSRGDDKLEIRFRRQGYGVDVTIAPNDNYPRYIGKSKYLKIQATKAQESQEPIGFRLRIIDERGTQWAWGAEFAHQDPNDMEVRIRYNTQDACGHTLVASSEGSAFLFPLNDKKKWTVFPNDGSAAPVNHEDSEFKVLQMVVIEPGIHDENSIEPPGHTRYLRSNEDELLLFINRIEFTDRGCQ